MERNAAQRPTLPALDVLAPVIVATLRQAGALFAFLHGSRARGEGRPTSDVDVAAWWAAPPPQSYDVLLPPRVDLLVLNGAPLELAGRVAQEGWLLFDDAPELRVHWLATTRKMYFDELPRLQRSHREFLETVSRGR